jgi:hypothetical protein
MVWTVWGSNRGGGEIFRTCKDRPWSPPSLLYSGYRVFPGVKSGRGVTLTTHPSLGPWSRKGRAIPLLPLWAVRTVQSLSACTRVHFTLPFHLYGWNRATSSLDLQRQLYNISAFRQAEYEKEILPIKCGRILSMQNTMAQNTHHISTTFSVHVRRDQCF